MIVGIGSDLCNIERIANSLERWGDKFLQRVFTEDWCEITPPEVAWHENDLAQLIGPRAWYVVAETNDRIEAARAAGGTVLGREEGLDPRQLSGDREDVSAVARQ